MLKTLHFGILCSYHLQDPTWRWCCNICWKGIASTYDQDKPQKLKLDIMHKPYKPKDKSIFCYQFTYQKYLNSQRNQSYFFLPNAIRRYLWFTLAHVASSIFWAQIPCTCWKNMRKVLTYINNGIKLKYVYKCYDKIKKCSSVTVK